MDERVKNRLLRFVVELLLIGHIEEALDGIILVLTGGTLVRRLTLLVRNSEAYGAPSASFMFN